jgi:hypothetical protein
MVLHRSKRILGHNQHSFMNNFIKRRIVLALNLGHHYVIIKQVSEFIQIFKIIEQEIYLNACGFHIVVLILLYDKGVSIPSNTTMFHFI